MTIARFTPVNNIHWFDIRQLEFNKWRRVVKRWLSIKEYDQDELPEFKPLVKCKNKSEFRKQFDNLPLVYEDNLSLF